MGVIESIGSVLDQISASGWLRTLSEHGRLL